MQHMYAQSNKHCEHLFSSIERELFKQELFLKYDINKLMATPGGVKRN